MSTSHASHHTVSHRKSKFRFDVFVSSLLLCIGAGVIGFYLTEVPVRSWYPYLQKPSLNPPSWVFGPVWTILYSMMAVAYYLIRIKPQTTDVKVAGTFFIIQLILNVLWSFSFFYLHSPFLGMVNIVVLWLMILITTMLFFRQSNTAGWLMVPYLLWVSFATYLNISIWLLN